MPKLKNRLEPVSVFAPAGGADALLVEHGQTVDVPGRLLGPGDDGYVADAHTVRSPSGELRAWATSRWELVEDRKPREAAARGDEED